MQNLDLGKLEEVENLRGVWAREDTNFTPWLRHADNISLLSDAIGIDIEVDDTESYVGNFRADIYAHEASTDRKIIIENQLERTDHDHLGKLITYASGKSAEVIVWIVKHACEEHKAAIEWLNNHTDEEIGFFLCEVKLYRIGDSKPAVKFEVLERPNDWAKEVKNLSPLEQANYDYWSGFNKYIQSKEEFKKILKTKTPAKSNYMDYSIGSSRCYICAKNPRGIKKLHLQIYIKDDRDQYDVFYENKEEIERESGLVFEWKNDLRHKSTHIVIERAASFEDKDKWNEYYNWMAHTMVKMKKTFSRYLLS